MLCRLVVVPFFLFAALVTGSLCGSLSCSFSGCGLICVLGMNSVCSSIFSSVPVSSSW